MSWAAGRGTTREEDKAYSLLGLFEVNIPLIYGEGKNAFIRLQEEIIRRSDDMSIFYWKQPLCNSKDYTGLLAQESASFSGSSKAETGPVEGRSQLAPYEMTNKGLKIELPLARVGDRLYFSVLDCSERDDVFQGCHVDAEAPTTYAVGVCLYRLYDGSNQFSRVYSDRIIHLVNMKTIRETVFVRQTLGQAIPAGSFEIRDSRLLLSSIRVICSDSFRRKWKLCGLWQRQISGSWFCLPFDDHDSEASSEDTARPVNVKSGRWGNGVSNPLPLQKSFQAVAIVVEDYETPVRMAVVLRKAGELEISNSLSNGRHSMSRSEIMSIFNSGLYVDAFLLPHAHIKLSSRSHSLDVGIVNYEASSGTMPGVESGQDAASSAQKNVFLCYTLMLRRMWMHAYRSDETQEVPLESIGIEKLFEEAFHKGPASTFLSPWSFSYCSYTELAVNVSDIAQLDR